MKRESCPRKLVRDKRENPHAWQEKEALRRMRDHYGNKKKGMLLTKMRSLYLALTEWASDNESDMVAPGHGIKELFRYSGLSPRSYSEARDALISLGLIEWLDERDGQGSRIGYIFQLKTSPRRSEPLVDRPEKGFTPTIYKETPGCEVQGGTSQPHIEDKTKVFVEGVSKVKSKSKTLETPAAQKATQEGESPSNSKRGDRWESLCKVKTALLALPNSEPFVHDDNLAKEYAGFLLKRAQNVVSGLPGTGHDRETLTLATMFLLDLIRSQPRAFIPRNWDKTREHLYKHSQVALTGNPDPDMAPGLLLAWRDWNAQKHRDQSRARSEVSRSVLDDVHRRLRESGMISDYSAGNGGEA